MKLRAACTSWSTEGLDDASLMIPPRLGCSLDACVPAGARDSLSSVQPTVAATAVELAPLPTTVRTRLRLTRLLASRPQYPSSRIAFSFTVLPRSTYGEFARRVAVSG